MLDEMFSEDNIYLGVDGNNFFEVLNNVSKELNKKKYFLQDLSFLSIV